jgi:hypothetical protein
MGAASAKLSDTAMRKKPLNRRISTLWSLLIDIGPVIEVAIESTS